MRLLIILLTLVSVSAVAECNVSPLKATYSINEYNSEGQLAKQYPLILWRQGNQVAHQYPSTRITEIWNLTGNGSLHLERFFDAYHRGIEYQPGEIKAVTGKSGWELKNQLVSNQLLESMELVKTDLSGCDQIDSFASDSKEHINLQWLNNRKLIKRFEIQAGAERKVWKLERLETDKQQIEQFFTDRADYKTTDYADIGDNESDPFLLKMINLGFVEHGSSGFYDANGQPLEGGHAHHH